ncbi:DUF6879 family protein [Streptomyces clavuligerus]|uniref:DUF6879 family protein n=2 Tax=Streptomyces clavuligerus TaxID=1901 RepID=UPI00017FFC76|nr:DUF6879 family protein [Streptomyces clavuligerus]EDY49967.1 conserved hypothetical protein [Streptomyces clavuligerus]MBY6307767.1 hypothetical protein [Streptomyces clavuligerus]QCS09684.1 hypothetical protein CRV15_29050 [Streptomyces clavuligerus]QPJ98271.1 hypothetical protein GE265_35310 [Streptomyces clavuligerus]WDN56393.1 hypothetical protein LL058_31620 [Streptomyces clavuligerus]
MHQVPTWDELLGSAQVSAVHLEMRDAYAVDYEQGAFADWRAGQRSDPDDRASWWEPWHTLIADTLARGVVIRRARIVSEPVSEYTRFLHYETYTNIVAGEQVRWLPRRQASAIALPGNDFWLIDDRLIRWNHFTGEGASGGGEVSGDPAAARLCAEAFEAVWERATPHGEYKIR